MEKRINKKELIDECIEGVENRVDDDYALTDDEYDKFHDETKKIVSEFVKSYKYDVDMFGNECIEDYSQFQQDLMSEIYSQTSFFKEME
jgi:hypothetical protein